MYRKQVRGALNEYLLRIWSIFLLLEILYFVIIMPSSILFWPKFESTTCFINITVVDSFKSILLYMYPFTFGILVASVVPAIICCVPCVLLIIQQRILISWEINVTVKHRQHIASILGESSLNFNENIHSAFKECVICMKIYQ